MKKNREEILDYINGLKGYQGYVQFSDRPIEDIFKDYTNIKIKDKGGFVYEAYFFNGSDSITIKQINDSWIVDETKNIPLLETQVYLTKDKIKIKMAQIWKSEEDKLCEDMKVLKLDKVVFAGFEGGLS